MLAVTLATLSSDQDTDPLHLAAGDCAGLRLIPGATRSGKQKTPGFLKSLLRIQDSEE